MHNTIAHQLPTSAQPPEQQPPPQPTPHTFIDDQDAICFGTLYGRRSH